MTPSLEPAAEEQILSCRLAEECPALRGSSKCSQGRPLCGSRRRFAPSLSFLGPRALHAQPF
jgi:hypothetical protein